MSFAMTQLSQFFFLINAIIVPLFKTLLVLSCRVPWQSAMKPKCEKNNLSWHTFAASLMDQNTQEVKNERFLISTRQNNANFRHSDKRTNIYIKHEKGKQINRMLPLKIEVEKLPPSLRSSLEKGKAIVLFLA